MAGLKLVGNVWEVTADANVLMKFRRLFPRVKSAKNGAAQITSTEEVCRELQWFLLRHPLPITEKDRFLLDAKAASHKAREKQVIRLLTGETAPRGFPLALPLRNYQAVAADMAYTLRSLLLGDQVGLGKTAVYIALLAQPDTKLAVWVTMTHLQAQAQREIQRFCPGLRAVVVTRTEPYDIGLHPASRQARPDVVILNYQKLAKWAEALARHVRTLVFDEAQELRHDGTGKYAAAQYLRERATWTILGTGTPVYNYGGEIFNVIEVVKPGALGTWDEFAEAWAGERDEKGRAIVRDPRALGAHLRAEGLMLRRTRRDVGRELPALFRTTHVVDTDPEVIRRATSSAAELARIILAESGSGFSKMRAYGDIERILRQATGIAKAPYVAEFVKLLLENGEERVVVFAWHHAVYDLLEDALNEYGVVRYTGEQSTTMKENALRRFKAGPEDHGRARVLLLSLRAGAGIDGLQHVCRTGVFAELDWSPKVHEQDEGRLCRDGQTDSTSFYYLVATTGSDPVVMDVLQIKTGQADGIVDPDQDAVEAQTDPDKIRRLARSVLGST
jgi:SNF2 family DNA or RNA helicase